MKRYLNLLSIGLLLILSVGAFYGGLLLVADPSGNKIGMSIDLIKKTPFNDYLLPGIILIIFNGLLPILTIASFLKKVDLFPWFIVFQGCILIIWLSVELIMNNDFFFPIMHYPLYSISILLIILGSVLVILGKKQ